MYLLRVYELNDSGDFCTFTCYVGEVVIFCVGAWNLPLLVRSSEPARINPQGACALVWQGTSFHSPILEMAFGNSTLAQIKWNLSLTSSWRLQRTLPIQCLKGWPRRLASENYWAKNASLGHSWATTTVLHLHDSEVQNVTSVWALDTLDHRSLIYIVTWGKFPRPRRVSIVLLQF